MRDYTLSDLSDDVLLHDLARLVAQDRENTATLLAHIAEVDARRLYAEAGYPSMHAYCVEELRLSEDAASKRIQAARAARKFPALFGALADGRLHLTAVCLLAPYCKAENIEELIEAGTHRRKSEIQEMIAVRFGASGVAVPGRGVATIEPSPLQYGPAVAERNVSLQVSTDEHAPAHVDLGRSEVPEHSPEHYLLKLTISKTAQEKLRHAQALLSHAVPSGDMAQVLERALDALITQLEKRKLGSTQRPRASRPSSRPRYVPAPVRRAVWERDQGQCTFVSARGRRCGARRLLEFDHITPVARGGSATVGGVRLRCHAHNQYEAERAFGAEFMDRKRQAARLRAEARLREVKDEVTQDVMAGLRSLGCRGEDARRAAEHSGALECGSLEERMRAALSFLGKRAIEARTAKVLTQAATNGMA